MEAQRTADPTGIPRLSAVAEADRRVTEVNEGPGRGVAAVQAEERVAGELRAFGTAVAQRFGKDGAMLRAGSREGEVTAVSVLLEQQSALDQVTELIVAVKAGERAGAVAQRQTESERQGQRRGI